MPPPSTHVSSPFRLPSKQCATVGDIDGLALGERVGFAVGLAFGAAVTSVGETLGDFVGETLGDVDGDSVGTAVGPLSGINLSLQGRYGISGYRMMKHNLHYALVMSALVLVAIACLAQAVSV